MMSIQSIQHMLKIVVLTLFVLGGFVLFPSQVEASGTTLVAGLRAMDVNSQYCSQREGSPGYTPDTTSAGWSPLVRDTGGTDISCVKIYADPGPSTKDVRICVQPENNGTYFSSVCTGWASEGTNGDSVSSWSAGKDNDGIRISVENRDMPSGQTISGVQLGIQLSKKNSGVCNQPGTAQYTPSGGGWSSYAVDGGNGGYGGDFDCAKVYLNSTITTTPSPIYPTVTLTADQNPITAGGSTTLRWTSSNASSCSAIAGSGFSVSSTSGSDGISPASSQTYTIRCYSSTGHSSSKSVNMVVNAATTPTASLSASSNSVSSGSTVTLTWSSTNATSCSGTGSGFSTGNATSGTDTVNPTVDTTYTLTCTGTGGSATDSEVITIISTNPPIVDLTADDAAVVNGGSTTLRWTTSGAQSCHESGTGFSTGSALNGSDAVTPSSPSTTYTLTCSNMYGVTSDSVTVSVAATGGIDLTAGTPAAYMLSSATGNYYSPSNLDAGDTIQFRSVIANQGTTGSAYYYTLFEIDVGNDGVVDSTQTAYNDGTSAGVSETVSTSNITLAGGVYAVRACADYYSSTSDFRHNRIVESDENNNCSDWYTFSTSDADLVAGTPYVLFGTLSNGNSIQFAAQITNQGTEKADDYAYNLFEIDLDNNGSYDTQINGSYVTRLDPSESQLSDEAVWSAVSGTHAIRACADRSTILGNNDQVDESDEDNNCGEAFVFTVAAPAPTATLQVQNTTTGGSLTENNITIESTDQISFSWTSTDATSCAGSNFSAGGATSGTQSSVSEPTAGNSTTYTLVCSGAGGSSSDSITVTANAPNPPTLTSNEAAEPIHLGDTATFDYDIANNDPASCSFTGAGVPSSISTQTGSFDVVIQGETTITLSCTGGDASETVRVTPNIYEN